MNRSVDRPIPGVLSSTAAPSSISAYPSFMISIRSHGGLEPPIDAAAFPRTRLAFATGGAARSTARSAQKPAPLFSRFATAAVASWLSRTRRLSIRRLQISSRAARSRAVSYSVMALRRLCLAGQQLRWTDWGRASIPPIVTATNRTQGKLAVESRRTFFPLLATTASQAATRVMPAAKTP